MPEAREWETGRHICAKIEIPYAQRLFLIYAFDVGKYIRNKSCDVQGPAKDI